MKLENIEKSLDELASMAAKAMGRKGGKAGGISKSPAKMKASMKNLAKAQRALKAWRKNNCK